MNFQHDILPLKDRLFRLSLRLTMNREEAEDVVQDVLLRLWQQRDELGKVANLENYALTMARNLSLDRMALAANRNVSLDETNHDRPTDALQQADNIIINKEKYQQLHTLIAQLPEKQRSIVQLRDIEGKTYKEIAEILSITEADVKVNLFRARTFLKKNYKFL